MVKNCVAAFALAVTATASIQTTNANYPCNPASWCHDRSVLCKSAESVAAILAGKPITNDPSRGVCTDAYRWLCNKQGFNCVRHDYSLAEAWERCQEIMDPSRTARGRYPGLYVEACRNGEYTCGNGFCTLSASDCSSRGGVKYGNVRCAKDSCGADGVLKDICDMNTLPTEASFECVEKPLAGVPACCPIDQEECRYLELEGAGELGLRQCGGECPDSCAPTSSPTAATAAPTKSAGQTASPTNAPDTPDVVEYPPAGVVVKFEQKFETRDCCCKISCDCFGDPHCTSFFGNQQTSKVSDGSFTMFSNLDIGVVVYLGDPQGIIEHLIVTTSDDSRKFRLSTAHCNNATHNWQDDATGKFVSDVPQNWDASYSIAPTRAAGFTDPTLYKVRDKKGQILIEITCQNFLWQVNTGSSNPRFQRDTRLDVVVTAWRDKVITEETGEICCPSQEQNEEWVIQTGAQGYCVDPTKTPIPGGILNPGRRLKTVEGKPLLGFSAEKEARIANVDNNKNNRRNLATAEEVCAEYLEKAGKTAIAALDTMEECLQNIGDFGIGSITNLIALIDNSERDCISDPLDPRLPGPGGLKECEAGVELEIQLHGTSEWIQFQSFPAGLPYCDNQLAFDFSRIEIQPGRFLSAQDKYRLKQCSANPDRCGVCAPLMSLENVGFSFTYECETYDSYKTFLKYDLLKGMKEGEFSCGFKYFGSEDPLACLKDYLPSLFK